MKKIIYIISLLYLVGCNVKTPERKDITNNTKIDSVSRNTEHKTKKSAELISFKYSECLENTDLYSKIFSTELLNDTLILKLGVHLNCAGNFNGSFVKNSDTLNLKAEILPNSNGVEVVDDCNCFYQLEYVISSIAELPSTVLINNMTLEDNYKYGSIELIDIENINED